MNNNVTTTFKKATNQVANAEKRVTVSQALASNAIKQLAEDLNLTQAQKMKASSAALTLAQNDNLKDCDGLSIVRYCFETARFNFGRDDCVYPVPYKNKIQAQVGYKGFRELALRSGYKNVDCNEVYDCDKVYRDRATGSITVEFEEDIKKTENAKLIGFYAYAIDENGELSNHLYWSVDKCMVHGKKYSKTFDKEAKDWKKDSIWKNEFEKMAKKTVIKQLCSTLKSTDLLEKAIKLDQLVLGKAADEDEYADNSLNTKKSSNNKVKNRLVDDVLDVNEETGEVVTEATEEVAEQAELDFGEEVFGNK